jgi:hypothetical protein
VADVITAEDVAAAEAELAAIKEENDHGTPERGAAMQAVADLRMAFRLQEEAAGRRSGPVAVVNNEGGN